MKKQLPLLRDQFVSNWLYKLIALLVALSIWVTTLQGRKDFVRWKNIDVEFLIKSNYVITNIDDRTIKIQVSGSRMSLGKLNQSAQNLSINLLSELPGSKHIEIRPADINLPVGVKLLSIQPKYFDLEIKEVKTP